MESFRIPTSRVFQESWNAEEANTFFISLNGEWTSGWLASIIIYERSAHFVRPFGKYSKTHFHPLLWVLRPGWRVKAIAIRPIMHHFNPSRNNHDRDIIFIMNSNRKQVVLTQTSKVPSQKPGSSNGGFNNEVLWYLTEWTFEKD